jgi:hypothetical protein
VQPGNRARTRWLRASVPHCARRSCRGLLDGGQAAGRAGGGHGGCGLAVVAVDYLLNWGGAVGVGLGRSRRCGVAAVPASLPLGMEAGVVALVRVGSATAGSGAEGIVLVRVDGGFAPDRECAGVRTALCAARRGVVTRKHHWFRAREDDDSLTRIPRPPVRRSAPHIGGYGGSAPRERGGLQARYDRGFCDRAAKPVRAKGLEPPRCCHQQDLNLPRLPFRHARVVSPEGETMVRSGDRPHPFGILLVFRVPGLCGGGLRGRWP